MNKDSYEIAKLIGLLSYIIVGVVFGITAVATGFFAVPVFLLFLMLFIVSIAIMCFIASGKGNVEKYIPYIETVYYLAIVYGLSCAVQSCIIVIVGVYLQIIANILYSDRKLVIIQATLDAIVVFSAMLFSNAIFGAKFSPFSIIVATLGVVFGMLLCQSIIWLNMREERRNLEQEQSLDDLLKVVENKCDEARAADKSKSAFLANISHEIRTPLNAILGMNEMISKEDISSQVKEYTENIDNYSRELLIKINDILDYSRIDAGNLELNESEYYLQMLLDDINHNADILSKQKKIQYNTVINPDIPEAFYGDIVAIKRVVNNLISNAFKYTKQGSVTLSVDFKKVGESIAELIISVSDTGTGISEKEINNIFKPFGRSDEGNRYVQGTGMGLALTKKLVNLMGGEITADSTLGKGSTFIVSFNQKITSSATLGETKKASDVKPNKEEGKEDNFAGVNILAVDDTEINLKVFKGLLKKIGADIDTAKCGKDCLSLAAEKDYDIIFLDHMMPEMDGVQTLENLLKMPGFDIKKTPVVVLTANAVEGAREEYISMGFVDYISKPVKKNRLVEILNKYVKASASEENVEEDLVSANDTGDANKLSISNLSFLNTADGLSSCGNDEELYLEIVREYYVSEKSRELENFFQKEDWKNYEILVHALKSTSKSIGADDLSLLAKELEGAAKSGDIDYIKANHKKCHDAHQELLGKLGELCDNTSSTKEKDNQKSNKYLVYVVDDDSVNRKVANGILSKFFDVREFGSGEQVLEALEEKIPNLILLDIMMPGMSGFDVEKKMAENPKWKEIPVIFLTASDDMETEVQGFKFGAMDFIRKPFVPQIMLERINRIIELVQLRNYLESEVDRKSGKVERLSSQAMETLAMTIDAKDKYTNGHSTRVAKYSREIAKRIGFNSEDQNTIYYMGLLHDIGKIGVPDNIINKDGKLTDEEFAMIKKHPEIGYGILKNITEIPDIEKGARWHHERYDGRGYPDGLKGNEIPLFARIIAVADSYDAMTSKRSYRDVLPQDFVRNEIIKGKGTQFDPACADVMVGMIDEDQDYEMKE